jgi:hypothetical protein
MGADPSTFWYKGELGFFDNYVIPLANKLKECHVSSDECLSFALQNRQEWETRGEAIVESIRKEIEAATIKGTAKATSAQVGVPLDDSLAESEMKRVTAAPPEYAKSA